MEDKRLTELKQQPNFDINNYPYFVNLPYLKVKKGMKILDYGYDYDDSFYYMFEVKEDVYKDKVDDNGTIYDCYVILELACAKDGTVLYDIVTRTGITDGDMYIDVYFSSIEEAKSFGIEKTELKPSNLKWVFEGFGKIGG